MFLHPDEPHPDFDTELGHIIEKNHLRSQTCVGQKKSYVNAKFSHPSGRIMKAVDAARVNNREIMLLSKRKEMAEAQLEALTSMQEGEEKDKKQAELKKSLQVRLASCFWYFFLLIASSHMFLSSVFLNRISQQ